MRKTVKARASLEKSGTIQRRPKPVPAPKPAPAPAPIIVKQQVVDNTDVVSILNAVKTEITKLKVDPARKVKSAKFIRDDNGFVQEVKFEYH